MTHPAITDLLAAGVLREQCAHCEHEEGFHEDRRCTLCWDSCVYAAAFVQRHRFVQNPNDPHETDCDICGIMHDLHYPIRGQQP